MSTEEERLPFIAYQYCPDQGLQFRAAPIHREWMDQTKQHFANRCLPLLIANQHGWEVLSPHPLRVTWTGSNAKEGLLLEEPDGPGSSLAVSHFGHGILTWTMSYYLFRTPPGVNLWVRGPANRPKDGASALEGIVETDWTVSTFTMNWKITRPHVPISFEAGEPICLLVPVNRGALEQYEPRIVPIESEPELASRFHHWANSRDGFLEGLADPTSEVARQGWQKDYFQGKGGVKDHQRRLHLRPFLREEASAEEDAPSHEVGILSPGSTGR